MDTKGEFSHLGVRDGASLGRSSGEVLGPVSGDSESDSEGFYFSGLGGLGGGTERRI